MDQDTIIYIAIGGYVLSLIIFYQIVKNATDSAEHTRLLKTQIKLLGGLLIKQGSTKEEVQAIIDTEKPKPTDWG